MKKPKSEEGEAQALRYLNEVAGWVLETADPEERVGRLGRIAGWLELVRLTALRGIALEASKTAVRAVFDEELNQKGGSK